MFLNASRSIKTAEKTEFSLVGSDWPIILNEYSRVDRIVIVFSTKIVAYFHLFRRVDSVKKGEEEIEIQ